MAPLLQRRDGGLDVVRARRRTSAFVYGNITVLGAVVAVGAGAVADGAAVLAVLATALTTFVAHVVADVVSSRVTAQPEEAPPSEHEAPHSEHEVREELRDAAPVATSGVLPALVLALGWLWDLDAGVLQLLAALVVVARLALTGVVVQRLSGRAASPAALWGGLALAAVSAVVAVVKAVATH